MAVIATPEDTEYLVLRDALLHDAARDQRIHHWISSQYDFALSELDIDSNNSKCMAPSRADSPLLGFDEAYRSANTSRSSSWDGNGECPSYDPLFFTPKTEGRELSEEEARFEDEERERALKFLIEEMHGGRVFAGPAREKALPAIPRPTPQSTPSRSRTHSTAAYTPSRRASRMPSIGSALSAKLNALPTQEEEPPLPELPSPCVTPTPGYNLSVSTTSLASPMRLGHTRSRGTLSFSPPTSPSAGSPSFTAPWSTSPPGTPALSFSSPPVSPSTTRFSRRTGSIESSLNLGLTTTPPSEDSHGEYEYGREIAESFTSFAFAPFPVEDADRLAAGPASQSRWSLGSSLAHDDDDAPAALASEKGQPNTRRRLKSLISLLSPHPSPEDADAPVAKDSPKIKHKGSLASLGYHRRSHMLPPRSTSPAPPTPSLNTAFALPSIAQSPSTPTFPAQAQQLQAPTPPPAPVPTAAPPPSPPKKSTLLQTLGLKRPKTPKASKSKPARAAGPKRILVLKAPEAARPALLAWCQAFGEVTAFTALPAHAHSHCAPRASEDGVLVQQQALEMETEVHVEFACAKVAETVCRVRGEVAVAGWNVSMGWF